MISQGTLKVRDCPQTSAAFIRVSKELRNRDEYNQVLFSGFCRKVNRFNKSTDRGLLITDKCVYKLEPKKQFKLTGLSVTSGADQMVALHTTSQDDVLLCLQRGELCSNQDRVGELVGALVDHFTRSFKKCPISSEGLSLGCAASHAGKPKSVSVESKSGQNNADFKKSRDGFILLVPAN
ncbi:hypothetical protein F7725_025528 [Dissostichus mawsoni]|uniref:TH1 domain-containing protein n=1 Tax=Dissostichus mawsoni TaxID=36200 RepID=A0A7J5XBF8_DISMA|nr:hypothetical protein F7725_025528 [Dissostichus mawsoni]